MSNNITSLPNKANEDWYEQILEANAVLDKIPVGCEFIVIYRDEEGQTLRQGYGLTDALVTMLEEIKLDTLLGDLLEE